MAIEQMTYEEAREHLHKAKNRVEPGEFITNRTPPIKQDEADPNGPGFPNPLFRTGNLDDSKLPTSRPSGDRVKPAKMPNPDTTYNEWLADAVKLSGKFRHTRQDNPTGRARDLDDAPSYKTAATDISGVACSELCDAASEALNAKSADEREGHLGRCMQLLHAACVGHEALKGNPLG